MSAITEMSQDIIAENARVIQDQSEYRKRYDELLEKYDLVKSQHENVVSVISSRDARSERLAVFILNLKSQDIITEFDEQLWNSLVEYVTVDRNKGVKVTFRDGTEIQV